MNRIFMFFIILLFSVKFLDADFNRAKMDSLFTAIEKNNKGMGSISIQKGNKEIYHYVTGYLDIENQLKADESTKYRIGSISKSFTGVIIFSLIDENKLSLDTKISKFFPSIPNSKKITIEHLLRHKSGLFNFTNAEDYVKWMEKPKSKDELLNLFIKNGTVFEPGEKIEYSNTNFVLLSWIAEEIEKKDFSQVFIERIVKPLDLKNTYLGGKINPEKNEAYSYYKADTWMKASETDMSIPWGAGAVVSTPKDINGFYYSLFNGKLISRESYKKMTDFENNTGLGLFVFPFFDRTAIGHNGGIDGFQSNAGFFPEDSIFACYLSNGVDMALNDILIGVLSILFDKEYKIPDFQAAYTHTQQELQLLVGTYHNSQLKMDLTISIENGKLTGQATNQSAFPLESYEKNKFQFNPAMLKIDFLPEQNKLILHQGGQDFDFIRNN